MNNVTPLHYVNSKYYGGIGETIRRLGNISEHRYEEKIRNLHLELQGCVSRTPRIQEVLSVAEVELKGAINHLVSLEKQINCALMLIPYEGRPSCKWDEDPYELYESCKPITTGMVGIYMHLHEIGELIGINGIASPRSVFLKDETLPLSCRERYIQSMYEEALNCFAGAIDQPNNISISSILDACLKYLQCALEYNSGTEKAIECYRNSLTVCPYRSLEGCNNCSEFIDHTYEVLKYCWGHTRAIYRGIGSLKNLLQS